MTAISRLMKVALGWFLAMTAAMPAFAQRNTENKYDKPGTVALQELLLEQRSQAGDELSSSVVPFRPDRDTPAAMAAYGAAVERSICIVRTVGGPVFSALETAPGSRGEEARFNDVFAIGKACGSPGTQILALQRGMLSEAAYLVANPEQKPLPMNVDSAAVRRFSESETERNGVRPKADRILANATNCLVASNPAIADLLARTAHGSDDEEVVLNALFGAALQCAGAKPTAVGNTFLRAFIMDSLYRASISEVAKPIFDLGG